MGHEQLINILRHRLKDRHLKELTFADAVSVVQGWDANQKMAFVRFILSDNPRAVGELKAGLLEIANQRADAEVQQMISDNQLSLEELDRVLDGS